MANLPKGITKKAWDNFRKRCSVETPTAEKAVEYFWMTYDYPEFIRALRNEIPIGKRFTMDDVMAAAKNKNFGSPDNKKHLFNLWLDDWAIENRHYQIMDKEKQIDDKVTYIFI